MATPNDTRTTIHTVVSHHRMHLDEIFAYWMLLKFGKKHFRFSRKIRIWSVDAGSQPPNGFTAAEWQTKGYLALGVWKSDFDEHPDMDIGRKSEESATSLMAKYLGVERKRELRQLLQFITDNDLNGGAGPFSLPAIIGALNASFPTNPDHVVEVTFGILDALYAQAESFQKAFREAQLANITSFGEPERPINLLVVRTANESMIPVAWFVPSKPDVVMLTHDNGQAQIFANNKRGFQLNELAAAIRVAEAAKNGIVNDLPPEVLQREGSVLGAEVWHYFTSAQMLFNGSLTAPNTPPTKLTTDELIELITQHVHSPVSTEPTPEN